MAAETQPQSFISFEFVEGEKNSEPRTKTIDIPLHGKLLDLNRVGLHPKFGRQLKLTELTSLENRECVEITQFAKPEFQEKFYVLWISERNEWVAIKYSFAKGYFKEPDNESWTGPYTPDPYCLLMVGNAFDVAEKSELSRFGVGEFLHFSPDVLKKASPNFAALENLEPDENDGTTDLRIDMPRKGLFALRIVQKSPNTVTRTFMAVNLCEELVDFGSIVQTDNDFSMPHSSIEEMEKLAIGSLKILEKHAPDKSRVAENLRKVIELLQKKSNEQYIKLLPE